MLQAIPDRSPTVGGVDGTTPCGRAPIDSAQTCGEPSAWHIHWTPERDGQPGSASFACDPHMGDARRYAYLGRHRVGADCNMPGARWSARRCYVPAAPENGTPNA